MGFKLDDETAQPLETASALDIADAIVKLNRFGERARRMARLSSQLVRALKEGDSAKVPGLFAKLEKDVEAMSDDLAF